MTDPDIEAACEDITKGLKTHRGCSPGTIELLPCPFCASSSVDPEGWMSCDPDGSNKRTGPACDDCGASAESDERWNTRDWAPGGVAQRPLNTDAEPSPIPSPDIAGALSAQLIAAAKRPECDTYSATLLLHASQMIDGFIGVAQAAPEPTAAQLNNLENGIASMFSARTAFELGWRSAIGALSRRQK